jgi:hypothetical protein
MRALTIWQPWSSLIMIGAKPYEFRRWDYRTRERSLAGQRIVIHAGARPIKPAEVLDIQHRLRDGDSSLVPAIAAPLIARLLAAHKCQGILPLAVGLGTAILGTPKDVNRLFKARDSNRIDHHMWAWPLTDIRAFPEPIPMRGMQGFWEFPMKVESA